MFKELGYQHNYWYPAQKRDIVGWRYYYDRPKCSLWHRHHVYGQRRAQPPRRFRRRFCYELIYSFGDLIPSVWPLVAYMHDFQAYINELKNEYPNLVICGDYNICHEAIDIHDPVRNAKVSGFLPEERAWLDGFIKQGFTDSFRHLNEDPHHYSWWSYRANARGNNKGWRIDYAMVSEPLTKHIERAFILPQAVHSDHCPVGVTLNMDL